MSSAWGSASSAAAADWSEIDPGGRSASSAPAIGGEASAYPTRSEASAQAFESVRQMTRLPWVAIRSDRSSPPNSTYAWSITTSPWHDVQSSVTTSRGISSPVGLLGEQTQTRRAPGARSSSAS
jgi:hypothetical protein